MNYMYVTLCVCVRERERERESVDTCVCTVSLLRKSNPSARLDCTNTYNNPFWSALLPFPTVTQSQNDEVDHSTEEEILLVRRRVVSAGWLIQWGTFGFNSSWFRQFLSLQSSDARIYLRNIWNFSPEP